MPQDHNTSPLPPEDDELGSYYRLNTLNRWQFDLDLETGERIGRELDEVRENFQTNAREDADLSFIKFTDNEGSIVRVKVHHVEAFYLSTPETRARGREKEDKVKAYNQARKDWDDDN